MSTLGWRELGPDALWLALPFFWRHSEGLDWLLLVDCKMEAQCETMACSSSCVDGWNSQQKQTWCPPCSPQALLTTVSFWLKTHLLFCHLLVGSQEALEEGPVISSTSITPEGQELKSVPYLLRIHSITCRTDSSPTP